MYLDPGVVVVSHTEDSESTPTSDPTAALLAGLTSGVDESEQQLGPEKLALIRERIADGFYDGTEVLKKTVRGLIDDMNGEFPKKD